MTIAEKLTAVAENSQNLYDAGKQAASEAFWDSFQDYGNLKNYKSVFSGRGWKQEVFYPKYDIIATNAVGTFQEFGGTSFDLAERLVKCGVTLDVSNATLVSNLFFGTPFTKVPHINPKSATSLAALYQNSYYLVEASIELKDDGSQTWQNTFYSCIALEDFTITSGTIGQNGFNVSACKKLTKDSILSILNACNKDVKGQGISITLPSKYEDGTKDTKAMLDALEGNDNPYKRAKDTYGYTITFA